MNTERVKLAAATWTNLTSTLALTGNHVIVRASGTDFKIGRKATAPTNGPVLTQHVGTEVIVKTGDTLVLWAYSTAGGYLEVQGIGGETVVIDGTGTT